MPKEHDVNEEKNNENLGESEFEVLQVFGIKLKVKNRKIADLLTTDVKEDISIFREKIENIQQLDEDQIETDPLRQIESTEEFEDAINAIGRMLGFNVDLGGIWRSPTGIAVLLKPVFARLDFEAAKTRIKVLAAEQARIKTENAGLFITRDDVSCDIMKAAVRSINMYQQMRVISYDNLYELLKLKENGYLKHRQVVTLMVPLDNVDVGELLNIIKAVAVPISLEDYLIRKKS
jgi:hypothetical protein